MDKSMPSGPNPELRVLQESDIDDVSGGFLLALVIGAELFAIGFGAGVVACNVANNRPWYEF